MAVINILKGLIGKEDLNIGSGTFTRLKSDGTSQTMTKVNLRSFNTGIFNVKDYGAAGDGSSNDTLAIQSAIDAAQDASGGVVYFPAGTYSVTSQLTIAKRSGTLPQSSVVLSIVGEGAPFTIVQWDGTAGTCLKLEGDASGNNNSFLMSDIAFKNNGTGTIGLDLNFATFSPTLERVQVWQFSDKNYDLENFENGAMYQCRAELGEIDGDGKTSKYGIYLNNANGILLSGVQVHGEGSRNGTDGSYGIYAIDCDSIVGENVIIEGGGTGASPTNLDVGYCDAGGLTSTRGHGGNKLHAYIERVSRGVYLQGNSTRPARNYQLTGRISGNIDTACIALDYADNVSISQMHLQANSASYVTTTSNTNDVHIGQNTYSNGTGISYDSDMSRLIIPNEGWYWQAPNEKASGTNQTSTVSATDFTTSQVSGDERIPLAGIYRLKLTVNTVGDAGTICTIALQPKGSGANEQHFLTINDAATAGEDYYAVVTTRTSYNAHQMTYSINVGTNWDVDYQIVEQAVYLG